MLRKIKLYGPLAKFIGKRVFEADVANPAEAIRFLVANFPAIEKHMADQHYKVTVGKYAITLDELEIPAGMQEIKITPVVVGAGGSTAQIIAGVALIALSFVSFGQGAWAGVLGSFGTKAGAAAGSMALFKVGAFLVLGGVAQLLAPVPQTPPEQTDARTNFNFSGIQQTSRQGVPVPIVYGKTLAGSVVISAGVDTEQVKV